MDANSQVLQRSRFDGRAAIAADTGSRRVDQRYQHLLTAIVLAGARITKPAGTFLHALPAELRGRVGADRAGDGGRLVPGQELEGAWERGGGVLAGDTECQFRSGAEVVLMREHDPRFESAAQGLAQQRISGGRILGEGRLGRSDQLLDQRGDVAWSGAPRQLPFDGKLEGAQMVAAFQPDGAEQPVEIAKGGVGGCLQVHPVIGRVTDFHDQMEPAQSRFGRHGHEVLCPAGFEMVGHWAFAKHPIAKPALSGGEWVIHSSILYSKGQSGSSPFQNWSLVGWWSANAKGGPVPVLTVDTFQQRTAARG